MTGTDVLQLNGVLKQILELSLRISDHSPPMKPFIRFGRDSDPIYEHKSAAKTSLFWDFDYALQKVLLGAVWTVAVPEQLSAFCLAQWDKNLNEYKNGKRYELQSLKESGRSYRFNYTPRDEFILNRIKPGSRFLYLGCGAGTECLKLANLGLSIIGIDNSPGLVDVANEWSEYLSLPFKAICMNAQNLDLDGETFDGFLIEFYGEQPLYDALLLQRNLAQVLRDGGKGFIVATRKKYSSFWFRMGTRYSKEMTSWLISQAVLDQRYSKPDNFEEQLWYGLFNRSHTEQSLASELSNTFEILECSYEMYDPRYVMGVVGKKEINVNRQLETHKVLGEPETPCLDLCKMPLKDVLKDISIICDILEEHEGRVSQFFDRAKPGSKNNPLHAVQADLPRFIELLEDVFIVLSDPCA